MKPRCVLRSRFLTIMFGALVALSACPAWAHADAGVPMLALMAVPMWASLLVIIPLEAFVATRRLGTRWGKSLKVSSVANIVSTVVGVPLTWLVLVAVEMGLQYAGGFTTGPGPQNPLSPLVGVAVGAVNMIVMAPWLVPYEGNFYWMIPTAALILCVPFFFASVWIEYLIARLMMGREHAPQTRDWAWMANIASYGLLVLVPGVLLATGLIQHARTAGDDEHRSVEQVSAERLWQIAIAREDERQAAAAHPRSIPTPVGDARPQAMNRADSLWRVGDDEHRAGDDARAEQDWIASLAEYDRLDSVRAQPGWRLVRSAMSPSEAACSLANLYYDHARYAEARPLFERLVRRRDALLDRGTQDPFPAYPLDLALAYEKTGDTLRAEQFYRHVVAREGSLRRGDHDVLLGALIGLADLFVARGDSTQAVELYRRAAGMPEDVFNPRSADRALLQLVRICRAQRRFTEAETLLASGIAHASRYSSSEFPDSTGAGPLFLDLAMVYLDEGALPQAAHAAKTALRWDTRPREAAAAYALVLERMGRSKEASEWRQRANTGVGAATER